MLKKLLEKFGYFQYCVCYHATRKDLLIIICYARNPDKAEKKAYKRLEKIGGTLVGTWSAYLEQI